MMVGAELAHQREHVAAEAVLVGGRMAGLEDAAIDAAAEMLDEGAEQARVGVADGEVAIEQHVGFSHRSPSCAHECVRRSGVGCAAGAARRLGRAARRPCSWRE